MEIADLKVPALHDLVFPIAGIVAIWEHDHPALKFHVAALRAFEVQLRLTAAINLKRDIGVSRSGR